ncbi:molybdenum cofactor sulfurase [Culex quinquefasciatus]|uniref:Molybdenum cofactor sulfurase n=1 Tax=Culex quinquefasciatus TaxID=7176 RepID=B0WWI1_CULQU|nr:molybdenum cofactor sulfurase [Culex quinquefasciatus]|eukprot:XP_001861753.1 molybdenum cofactor sulfurase [Culex quinquefasciatus]
MGGILPHVPLDEIGTRSSVFLATGVGLASATGYGLYKYLANYWDNQPPQKWRQVGELADLYIYPIKSCGAIRVTHMDCTIIGPKLGLLRDRIFMVTRTDGTYICARTFPKLLLIQPSFNEQFEQMTLSAPGMPDITVPVNDLFSVDPVKAWVWGQPVTATDCSEELARWISRFVLNEESGLRLVFYPLDIPTRPVRERQHVKLTARDTGALHNSTSFMLLTEASVGDLNRRLQKPVTAQQFRPNFVVKGPGAFEEDDWKWIKIGETVYRNVKPCNRCSVITVDPETGVRSNENEPMKTLKTYRMKPGLETPVMGMQMGIRIEGTVQVGDAVYVGY